MLPAIVRFHRKVIKDVGPLGCWIWVSANGRNTYWSFWDGDKATHAHRFSYSTFVGPIFGDLQVLHTCDNKACANPDHLFLGTQLDNMVDMRKKGREKPSPPICPAKGERHGMARIGEEQALQIIARYRKCSYHRSNAKELAEEFKISVSMVINIVSGRNWGHLPR